jgi:hypothetical protein
MYYIKMHENLQKNKAIYYIYYGTALLGQIRIFRNTLSHCRPTVFYYICIYVNLHCDPKNSINGTIRIGLMMIVMSK